MMIAFEAREAPAAGRLPRHAEPADERIGPPASPLRLVTLASLAILGMTVLLALGIWQLERRVWKLDLIARVNARVQAVPVAAPGPSAWPGLSASDDAYRHVRVKGRFLGADETLVLAVTERGAGYWVLAPFQTIDGFIVLINRGFVPTDEAAPDRRRDGPSQGETEVTGLLRINEPGGGFLRHNDPRADRWYSRDVAAIAASRGIKVAAPYFIDADASPDSQALPVGGLTVIAFPNNHLVYALTWFTLAAMLAGWSLYAARLEWTIRKR